MPDYPGMFQAMRTDLEENRSAATRNSVGHADESRRISTPGLLMFWRAFARLLLGIPQHGLGRLMKGREEKHRSMLVKERGVSPRSSFSLGALAPFNGICPDRSNNDQRRLELSDPNSCLMRSSSFLYSISLNFGGPKPALLRRGMKSRHEQPCSTPLYADESKKTSLPTLSVVLEGFSPPS